MLVDPISAKHSRDRAFHFNSSSESLSAFWKLSVDCCTVFAVVTSLIHANTDDKWIKLRSRLLQRKETSGLLTTIKNQGDEIEMKDKEIIRLKTKIEKMQTTEERLKAKIEKAAAPKKTTARTLFRWRSKPKPI